MKRRKGFCQCDRLSHQPPVGWFERILMKVFPHFDIVKTIEIDCGVCQNPGPGHMTQVVLYLRRFYIWRSEWIGMNFGELYLHKIVRSDDDRDPHTHPWPFLTLLLKGAYRDEAWGLTHRGTRVRLYGQDDKMSAPAVRYRNRDHIHRVRVDKPNAHAWTLVFTGPYWYDSKGDASWGFETEKGYVPWREYLGLPDNEEHGG